jgi:hypothetical protein
VTMPAGSGISPARECTPDDLFLGPWMVAGPHRLTIVRDGTVVHGWSQRLLSPGASRLVTSAIASADGWK